MNGHHPVAYPIIGSVTAFMTALTFTPTDIATIIGALTLFLGAVATLIKAMRSTAAEVKEEIKAMKTEVGTVKTDVADVKVIATATEKLSNSAATDAKKTIEGLRDQNAMLKDALAERRQVAAVLAQAESNAGLTDDTSATIEQAAEKIVIVKADVNDLKVNGPAKKESP